MIKFKNLTETESLDQSPYVLLYSYNIVHTAATILTSKYVCHHTPQFCSFRPFPFKSNHCTVYKIYYVSIQKILRVYSLPLPMLQLPNPFRSHTQRDNLSQGICCTQKRASDNSLLFLNHTRVNSHSIYQQNYDQSHDLASILLSIFFVLFSFKTLITTWCSVIYLLTPQPLFQCLYESKDFGIFILQQTQCQEESLVEQ